MVEINSETQKTRRERLATVITIGISAFIHLFFIIGGLQFYKWVEEEEQKERLMVIRRIAETSPEPQRGPRPTPSRPKAPKDAEIKEEGPEPPEESELADGMEEELGGEGGEAPMPEDPDNKDTVMTVITDHGSATFTISGPEEYYGSGTFWMKKEPPLGKYTTTFHPVPGRKTPPIQTKVLDPMSKIVFKGRYTRSVEVSVFVNISAATFEIRGPEGIIPMKTPDTRFFDNLKRGSYTIIFHDVPGYLAPNAQTKKLGAEGRLSFKAAYLPTGIAKKEDTPARKTVSQLDRRVQMVVKSYPPTSIEEDFDYIRYPEIIIERSNFQTGWCRVYLVIQTDSSGRVGKVSVERPSPAEQELYSTLIRAVENAAKRWRYEKKVAEIHVDVRFQVE